MNFAAIFLISAEQGTQVDALEKAINDLLPEGPQYFPPDQVSDKTPRFMAAEIIREKLTRFLGQELPYAVTVEIEQFEREGKLTRIGAIIWVDRDGQKAIVIGKKGEALKKTGIEARAEIEKFLGKQVHLELFIKVKEKWRNDPVSLRHFGFNKE